MCLVCIAFASWVLRSADPMVADTWKAGKSLQTIQLKTSHEPFRHFHLGPYKCHNSFI
uniref:Secreted protein n=1 Tax=Esox lucius TaxID=8010 RepID=A0AAY5K645_ESOLU